jgi:A/G-specific adenine glycosylase
VIADSLLPRSEPRDFNFAMLDLAALVCTPQAPRHEICPLRRTCRKARGPTTSPHRHAPP